MATLTNPPTPSAEALVEVRLAALERQAADLAARLDQADKDKLALAERLTFTEMNFAAAITAIADLARAAGDQQLETCVRTIMDLIAAAGIARGVAAGQAFRDTSLPRSGPRRLRAVRSGP